MPFVKGVSGNPGGRPKSVAKIKELAVQCSDEAFEVLRDGLNADQVQVRISCAEKILKLAGAFAGTEEAKPYQAAPTTSISDAKIIELLSARRAD